MSCESHQDVPALSPGMTSSIGSLWPPGKASFGRIEGIYTQGRVATRRDAEAFVDTLESLARKHFQCSDGETTRISLRAVIERETLHECRSLLCPYLEALVPLVGAGEPFEESIMLYIGKNHEMRQPLREKLQYCRAQLNSILQLPQRTYSEIINRAQTQECIVDVLNGSECRIREQESGQIAELYQRFGWTRNDVSAILNNPNNFIGIARHAGRIVSAGIAEMAAIPIGSDMLRIAEITEAATLEHYERNGLYTAVSAQLLRTLAARSQQHNILDGEVNYIFGECNANAPGVLKIAHIQGRTFSLEAGPECGFPDSGVLPQHVPIAGAHRSTPYNDLFPAYLLRQKLYELYGEQQ